MSSIAQSNCPFKLPLYHKTTYNRALIIYVCARDISTKSKNYRPTQTLVELIGGILFSKYHICFDIYSYSTKSIPKLQSSAFQYRYCTCMYYQNVPLHNSFTHMYQFYYCTYVPVHCPVYILYLSYLQCKGTYKIYVHLCLWCLELLVQICKIVNTLYFKGPESFYITWRPHYLFSFKKS